MVKEEVPEQELFPLWLVKSKVKPARQQVCVLERPQITSRLDKNLNAIISLIQAPAGYGKSTVLSDWMSHLLAKDIDVSWVSIDREDNDPVQLLHYITFALYQGGVDMSNSGINTESYPGNHSIKNLLSILARTVESHGREVVLILDDFENLEEGAVNDVILPLIGYAPENFHIAIATRDDSNLKIADLELKGLAHRLTTDNLKFTLLELEHFLSDFIDQGTIKRVYQMTEGWPVAIQLIRSSVHQDTDIERVLNSITGSGSTIAAYLAQQIFENLEPDIQSFLMDICLVDRVSCDLADHLREANDSEKLFTKLTQLNALILPVEDVKLTYRLHPLFREFLFKKLEYDFPSRKTELYLRAAAWYSTTGDLVQASRFYIKSGHCASVEELVKSTGGISIWLTEGLARLRTIVNLLDEKTIAESPSLSLISCIIHIKDGEVYLAREKYDRILTLPGLQEDQKNPDQLQFELMVVKTLLTVYEGSQFTDAFIDNLKDTLTKVPQNKHIMRGHLLTCLCGLHVNTGDFQDAEQYAKRALNEFDKAKALYGKAYIFFHMGELLFAQGKAAEAEARYDYGYSLVKRYFNDDKAMKFVVNLFKQELGYELNRLDSLPKTVESLYKELEDNEAWFNIYAAGYTTCFKTIFSRQSADSALRTIDNAQRYIENQKLERVKTILSCLKINILTRSGNHVAAKLELKKSGIDLDDYRYDRPAYIAWREREAIVHAVCRTLIEEGEIEEAITRLNYFLDQAQRSGHLHSSFKYHILLALAHYRHRDQESMLESLNQVISISITSGFTRPILDEGDEIKELISIYMEQGSANNVDETYISYARSILQCFDKEKQSEQKHLAISAQELEIIQYLEKGYANKVIARNIGISHNTVRYHLKKIFSKLDVSNRSQAVSVARKRDLI